MEKSYNNFYCAIKGGFLYGRKKKQRSPKVSIGL